MIDKLNPYIGQAMGLAGMRGTHGLQNLPEKERPQNPHKAGTPEANLWAEMTTATESSAWFAKMADDYLRQKIEADEKVAMFRAALEKLTRQEPTT